MRVLAIRLLLSYSLRTDLGCVSNPQLKLQLGHESFEPASMPAGLHPVHGWMRPLHFGEQAFMLWLLISWGQSQGHSRVQRQLKPLSRMFCPQAPSVCTA